MNLNDLIGIIANLKPKEIIELHDNVVDKFIGKSEPDSVICPRIPFDSHNKKYRRVLKLVDVGKNNPNVIIAIKNIMNVSLEESRKLVSNLPIIIYDDQELNNRVDWRDLNDIKTKLEELGAKMYEIIEV